MSQQHGGNNGAMQNSCSGQEQGGQCITGSPNQNSNFGEMYHSYAIDLALALANDYDNVEVLDNARMDTCHTEQMQVPQGQDQKRDGSRSRQGAPWDDVEPAIQCLNKSARDNAWPQSLDRHSPVLTRRVFPRLARQTDQRYWACHTCFFMRICEGTHPCVATPLLRAPRY